MFLGYAVGRRLETEGRSVFLKRSVTYQSQKSREGPGITAETLHTMSPHGYVIKVKCFLN